MIQFNCPKCQKELEFGDGAAGQKVKCPQCKSPITVPVLTVATTAKKTAFRITVSSGDIPGEYEVIGIVFGFASKSEGCSGGIHMDEVYETAVERLFEAARSQGASALTHVNFQNRFGRSRAGGTQVLEVFAWGTAVRTQ